MKSSESVSKQPTQLVELNSSLRQKLGTKWLNGVLLTGSNNQFQNYKAMNNLNFSRKKTIAKKTRLGPFRWEEG